VDGYLTDIYGKPIFSFDYSTRANAPLALSAIASDGRPRHEILENDKKRDGNPKSLVTTA